MCKIPDSFDSVLDQNLRHITCLILRQCQNCDLNIVFFHKERKITDHLNLNPTNRNSLKYRIYIKNTDQLESSLLKLNIIGKCLPQITSSYNDHRMHDIQPQDLTNLCIKIFYIITVSLLSKSPEIIQILTYLRRCNTHFFTKIIGRDSLYIVFQKFTKVSIVTWQSLNHSF